MIERIRLSLWDVFTFFTSGCLAGVAAAIYLYLNGALTPDILAAATTVPTAVILVVRRYL